MEQAAASLAGGQDGRGDGAAGRIRHAAQEGAVEDERSAQEVLRADEGAHRLREGHGRGQGSVRRQARRPRHTQAGREALDAFWLAFQIPDMMFQLIILGALSAAFIPIFTSYKNKDQAKAFEMSSIMMNILLLVFLLVGVLIFIFAGTLTHLRTGANITPEQIRIIINLTRLMIFAQFFFYNFPVWSFQKSVFINLGI